MAKDDLKKGIEKKLQESANDFILTEQHLEILNERREKHRSGESKSYTWEEVKAHARKAHQDKKSV